MFSHSSRVRVTNLALLLGTASLVSLGTSALAQPAQEAPVEEILVTGSLIRGAQAVGVPVTALSQDDFIQKGAVTISDMLRSVPSVTVVAEGGALINGTGNLTKALGINIHDLNGDTPRTLTLFDGMRFPLEGLDNSQTDPSEIPALMTERVDILADGASAVYGSDAVAGVVNVILRRRFEGAETQIRSTYHKDAGLDWQVGQLYGTKWDSGDLTVAMEYFDRAALDANKRSFLTFDFTPWGLDNRTPVKSSIPATVHWGGANPSPQTGPYCDADNLPDVIPPNTVASSDSVRCYSVPAGQNGTGLTWGALIANGGTKNLINPWFNATANPWSKRFAVAETFDQRIIPGVEFFADSFFGNRRNKMTMAAGFNDGAQNDFTMIIPTTNPYYPTGVPPAGFVGPLRVDYNISAEMPTQHAVYTETLHYDAGFNVDLPYDWFGKATYSHGIESDTVRQSNQSNLNAVNAALGNTVPAQPGVTPGTTIDAFTKPAGIPYFNPFCDPFAFKQCNDPATLNYIRAYRNDNAHWDEQEYKVNFDGPVLALPGGDVRVAVGGGHNKDYFRFRRVRTDIAGFKDLPIDSGTNVTIRSFWSAFGEMNVPIVGEMNRMPGVQSLDLQISYRWDRYSDFGDTTNPRVAADWSPVEGLKIRGSWGTSFRAPAFADTATTQGRSFQSLNVAAGASSNTAQACSAAQIAARSPAAAGSAAAILNPNCSAANQFPAGVSTIGGAYFNNNIMDGLTRPIGFKLGPEKADNYTLGFNYTPQQFLAGLSLDLTYYHLRIKDLINGGCTDLNDPTCTENVLFVGKTTSWLTPDGDHTISQAEFDAAASVILAQSQVPPNAFSLVKFITDGTPRNQGTRTTSGVDFGAHYDWDIEDIGHFTTGIDGNYKIHDDTDGQSALVGTSATAGIGNSTTSRFRYRGTLGWSDGPYRVTGFVDYTAHYFQTGAQPPSCYIVNTSSCPAPYVPPFPNYSNLVPATYIISLSMSYDTMDAPANEYLKNIQVQLTINNLFDRNPPFAYRSSNNGGSAGFVGGDILGRATGLTITKNW